MTRRSSSSRVFFDARLQESARVRGLPATSRLAIDRRLVSMATIRLRIKESRSTPYVLLV
jgi:hypothetical protein